jgi:protein-tyrosine-phosphatase
MIKYILTILALTVSLNAMAQTRKVVFVCEHGAAKSVIAAAYFNKIAKERNLDYEAVCRGNVPDSTVSVSAKEGLAQDKLLDESVRPTKLSANDTVGAERIILFTKLPFDFKTSIEIEDWSKIKNLDAGYQQRRDAIIKNINTLLDTLSKQN